MEHIKTYLINITTGSGAMLFIEAIALTDVELVAKIICQVSIAAVTIHTMLKSQKDKK